MDASALRSELDLVAWDPRALAGGALWLAFEGVARSGYTLTDDDGRRFAWLDDPARCDFAPEAVTASSVLAIGRARAAPHAATSSSTAPAAPSSSRSSHRGSCAARAWSRCSASA